MSQIMLDKNSFLLGWLSGVFGMIAGFIVGGVF